MHVIEYVDYDGQTIVAEFNTEDEADLFWEWLNGYDLVDTVREYCNI
jgi:hypothetical protein